MLGVKLQTGLVEDEPTTLAPEPSLVLTTEHNDPAVSNASDEARGFPSGALSRLHLLSGDLSACCPMTTRVPGPYTTCADQLSNEEIALSMRAFKRMENISCARERKKKGEQAKADRIARVAAGLAQIRVDSELRRLVAPKTKQRRAFETTCSSTSAEDKVKASSSSSIIEIRIAIKMTTAEYVSRKDD